MFMGLISFQSRDRQVAFSTLAIVIASRSRFCCWGNYQRKCCTRLFVFFYSNSFCYCVNSLVLSSFACFCFSCPSSVRCISKLERVSSSKSKTCSLQIKKYSSLRLFCWNCRFWTSKEHFSYFLHFLIDTFFTNPFRMYIIWYWS